MTVRALVLLPLALLVACSMDSDGDGLSNSEENELGLDKDNADTDGDGLDDGDEIAAGADPMAEDSDGDGLLDGEEIENGCDPLIVDTDEDGYTDRDEVFEGHDPADESDRIYKGRWPYYYEKDELSGGSLTGEFGEGKRVARLRATDWFGDEVDLFDFHNTEGKPIVVDVSAQWCPPCQDIASWLDNTPGIAEAYDEYWPGVREAVENGDIYWVTILEEDVFGEGATKQTAREWHDAYPTKQIPVLGDTDKAMADYLGLAAYPTLFVLGPDLKIDFAPPSMTNDPYGSTLDYVVGEL